MTDFHRTLDFKPRYTRQHLSEVVQMLEIIYEDAPIRNMIEIGVFEGGSTYIWGQLVRPEGMVYAIDEQIGALGSAPTGWERQEPVYRGTQVEESIIEIVGRSDDPGTVERLANKIMVDGKQFEIDLLFIDGDHSYEMARNDFENFRHFVRKGGWIAFHDVKKPSMGVVRYWEEICRDYEYHEIIMQRQHPDARVSIYEIMEITGIGLIRWTG